MMILTGSAQKLKATKHKTISQYNKANNYMSDSNRNLPYNPLPQTKKSGLAGIRREIELIVS